MTKPQKICLLMQGGHSWIGGTEYIKNIILALASLPTDVRSTFELCLFCSKSLNEDVYKQIQPYLDRIYYEEVDLDPLNNLNRVRWKASQVLLGQINPRYRAFFKREKVDFAYPYYDRTTRLSTLRSAVWISDFQHKYLTHFFDEEEIRLRDEIFASVAEHVSTVVLSSKVAESDFHKFFPKAIHKTQVLSFKTPPSSEWYAGNPQKTQQEYSLPDRFFIISNQFWQHKNHVVVFKALKLLQEKSIYPVVVCTGHIHDVRQPSYSDIILQTIHKLGLSNQVYLLGLIPKADQIQLMRRSLAVIQPSLFEGWSTLVEDARCLGKQLILSDLPVNLEQNPPHSIFFERSSPERLASLLADWWADFSPGPDLEKEAIARSNNLNEAQAFGYRFLEIARSG